jgi:hypothetical protein
MLLCLSSDVFDLLFGFCVSLEEPGERDLMWKSGDHGGPRIGEGDLYAGGS